MLAADFKGHRRGVIASRVIGQVVHRPILRLPVGVDQPIRGHLGLRARGRSSRAGQKRRRQDKCALPIHDVFCRGSSPMACLPTMCAQFSASPARPTLGVARTELLRPPVEHLGPQGKRADLPLTFVRCRFTFCIAASRSVVLWRGSAQAGAGLLLRPHHPVRSRTGRVYPLRIPLDTRTCTSSGDKGMAAS